MFYVFVLIDVFKVIDLLLDMFLESHWFVRLELEASRPEAFLAGHETVNGSYRENSWHK